MEGADVSHLEAIGALNFLDLADIPLLERGINRSPQHRRSPNHQPTTGVPAVRTLGDRPFFAEGSALCSAHLPYLKSRVTVREAYWKGSPIRRRMLPNRTASSGAGHDFEPSESATPSDS
jgi:hypothetical protein